MLLQLFDLDHTRIAGLKNHKDAVVESELSTGDKTLSFSWHQRNRQKIQQEYYIRTDTDEYVVKENSKTSGGYRKITAKLNIEEIEGRAWEEFTIENCTAQEAADYALTDTGWTCKSYVSKDKLRKISLTKVNSYQIFEKILEAFTCEIQWDTLTKTVCLKEQIGEDKGVYFIDGLNLKEITDNEESYDFATIIVPIGADGLGIEKVNGGRNYLENYQYSSKKKAVYWEDSNYTDAQALMDDASYRLNEISKPKKTMRVKTIDLAKMNPKYGALAYSVGDIVTIISNRDGIKEKQRITKTVEYLENPAKNTCDVSNTVLSFEEMQKKLFAAAECLGNITTNNGTIKGSTVDKIDVTQIIGLERYVAEDIDDLRVNYLYARTELGTPYAAIGRAVLTQVQTTNLTVTGREDVDVSYINELHAGTLYGTNAVFKTIESDNIAALEARVNKIASMDITVEYLEANYAQVDFANVGIQSVATLFANVGLITDATIVDGHITGYLDAVSVNANNITAGTLAVDRLVIRGSTESLVYELNNITGALQAQNVNTLNGEVLTPRTINCDRIVAESITGNEIASQTITGKKIVAESITGNEIASQTITANKLNVQSLSAINANLGIVTAGIIRSTNYEYGNTGMQLNLATGEWDSKNYALDRFGNISANGITLIDAIYGNYSANGILQASTKSMVISFSSTAAYTKEITTITDTGLTITKEEDIKGTFHAQTNFHNSCEFRDYVKFDEYTFFSSYVMAKSGATITGNTSLTRVSISDFLAVKKVKGNMSVEGEVRSTNANAFRMVQGNYGAFFRNDGNDVFLLLTNSGDQYGDWNNLRPFSVNLASGNVTIENGLRVNCNITTSDGAIFPTDGNIYVNSSTCVGYLGNLLAQKIPITASCNKNWNWVGQSGQPTWVWGGNDNVNEYVYNPSNFYVDSARYMRSQDKAYNIVLDTLARFRSVNNGDINLGGSAYRWKQLYATTTTISTSDRNYKDNIRLLTEQHIRFFMLLAPVSFTFTDGTSGRTHIGFISQDVEEAMTQVGLTDLDFAGFCRDEKVRSYLDDGGNEVEEPVLDDDGNPEYIYSLRYEEFIGLITYALQRTISRMDDLEDRLEAVEKSLN